MTDDLTNAQWFKSSYSGGDDDCVEVAWLGSNVGVRDSTDPGGPALIFDRADWAAFTVGLQTWRFDVFGGGM